MAGLVTVAAWSASGCRADATDPVGSFAPAHPITVVHDRHGIPHINALSDGDVFWGQGYVTAELRPAQAEIFRLRSQGRGAEVFGEAELTTDIFVRSLDPAGHARRNWPALERDWPDTALAFAAYAAGFNRRMERYREAGWPTTLQVLRDAGFALAPWTAQDVYAVSLLIGLGLSGAPSLEIIATLAKVFLGDELFADLFRFAPPTTAAVVPGFGRQPPPFPLAPGAGLGPVATPPDSFGMHAGGAGQFVDQPRAESSWRRAVTQARSLDRLRLGGSNAFAVDGARSATGFPIVESDTHEGVPAPGTYLLVHLSSTRLPGARGTIDAIGASFPGAPLVVFGHNRRTAWSATIGYTDIVDFYWERDDPNDPSRVMRPGGLSLATHVRSETFRVRRADGGSETVDTEVRDIPEFGPILPPEFLPLPLPLKLSVRWTGLGLPAAVTAILEMNRAESVADHFVALRNLRGASAAFVFGDNADIAYALWNLHPRRTTDGPFKPWLVIPADIGPHWQGFLPFEQMPWDLSPTKGYVWTANTDPDGDTFDNLPGNDGPYYGFGYLSGYRGARIDARLAALTAGGPVDAAALEELQWDRYSGFAARLRPHLLNAIARSPALLPDELRPIVAAVAAWDLDASSESTAATVFYAWAHHLVVDLLFDDYQLLDELGEESMHLVGRTLIYWLDRTAADMPALNAGTVGFPSQSGIDLFDNRDTPDHVETLDEQVVLSLQGALAHLRRAFATPVSAGDDAEPDRPSTWHWRNMVQLRLRHTLAALDPTWERFDRTWGFAGNFDTVDVGGYTVYEKDAWQDRFYVTNAPSNRFMTEFAAAGVRASRFMLPSGQSEIPGHRHYNDLVEDYLHHRYREFPFTDAAISAAAEDTVTLP